MNIIDKHFTALLDKNAVQIEIKDQYGVKVAVPVCPRARIFADIAGTKTLTRATIGLIQQLGYDIVSRADADWRDVK